MKKCKFLKPKGDFIFFVDRSDEDKLYCMTRAVHEEMYKTLIEKRQSYKDADPDLTVEAFQLDKVDEDQRFEYYDIVSEEPIDFFVIEIQWVPVVKDPIGKLNL